MARTSTIQLVVITGSDNEAERLVSLFRSVGRVARAVRPQTSEDFSNQLGNKIDLLIIEPGHPKLPPQEALAQCRQQAPTLPVLVISEEAEVSPWFEAGASDVLTPQEESRLVAAALREVAGVKLQRELESVRQQLQEAEQRNALLLAEAQDAIAYISDGMVINANTLFAERFGFEGPDDLDCVSIVDLIAENSLDKVKAMLKAAVAGETSDFSFTGLHGEGDTFEANMQLCASNYDGEPCTQLTVRDSGGTAGTRTTNDSDAASGLANRGCLESELTAALTQLGQVGGSMALVYLGIDDFSGFRAKHGFQSATELTQGVAEVLAALRQHGLLASSGDDGFLCLLPDCDLEQAGEQTREAVKHVAESRFGSHNQTCTLSAGIVALSPGESAAALLEQAFQAAQQVRDKSQGNGVQIHRPALEKRAAAGADDLDKALEEALEDNRFVLLFQPLISLRGSAGEHYEVQLRFLNEDDEETIPETLLANLAQANGNTRLDRWMILEATKQLAEQRQQGNDTRLLLNLTNQALKDDTLLPWLGVALKAAGLPPECLIFQCRTEDASRDTAATQQFINAIRELGCRFSLSGFGVQEQPLNLLEQAPVNLIKLDGSLCKALLGKGEQESVKALVTGASERDIKVVVSQVENAAALATLWQVGADFIQGDYLQAPTREMSYEFTDIA